jgi:quercetin dioxygenase-like cupin family protein
VPPRADIANWDELALDRVTEMVSRRTVAGDELTLTQVYLKRGALVPRHSHAREQMVYVMEGAIRFVLAEAEDVTVREGEVLRIPAGQAHQSEALDDAFVIVVVGI